MPERLPNPLSTKDIESQKKSELLALARELFESGEIFPFSELEPESYAKLKAADEVAYPGYTTPTDEILDRMRSEGMKVVLGKYVTNKDVYILPALSDDIESDMISPKHFRTDSVGSEKLKELIEKAKSIVRI